MCLGVTKQRTATTGFIPLKDLLLISLLISASLPLKRPCWCGLPKFEGETKIIILIMSYDHLSLSLFSLLALLNPASAPGSRLDAAISSTTSSLPRDATPIQPLLGVAPLGPISLGQDKVYQLRMLESAFKHMPEPSDSEKVR